MSRNDPTDDYVAQVLQKDAERSQKRNLASGLGVLLGRRPRDNAPRPNTRFLRSIIQETHSHNATLKTREAKGSDSKLSGIKRRREYDGRDPSKHRRNRLRDKDRSRSPIRDRSRGLGRGRGTDDLYRQRAPISAWNTRSDKETSVGAKEQQDNFESDPLDDLIGPRLPPGHLPRGRGAYKASAIDARFAAAYDPATDVGLDADEEGNDWDMALEVIRDRAKWRQSGADRLHAAGFTKDEVARWKSGGSTGSNVEKDASNVQWRPRGEAREWDRGKVADGTRIAVRAKWVQEGSI